MVLYWRMLRRIFDDERYYQRVGYSIAFSRFTVTRLMHIAPGPAASPRYHESPLAARSRLLDANVRGAHAH